MELSGFSLISRAPLSPPAPRVHYNAELVYFCLNPIRLHVLEERRDPKKEYKLARPRTPLYIIYIYIYLYGEKESGCCSAVANSLTGARGED